jgi:anaerobic selenocysteine-containing dehydrogenase
MLNPADALRLGIREGDPVEVSAAVGSMRVRAAIIDIARGALAMYYPEANILVDARLDPESRTPAFKSVPVQIRKV